MSLKKIIIVCGPTGIGKTSFAIRLARRFGGEIISADSMQVYRYMDIGTAKPGPDELKRAKHHMIDLVCPDEDFDAGRYARAAGKAIDSLAERLPVIAGGTGFYIKALLYGLFRSEPVCRKTLLRLERELEERGKLHLYKRLEKCDPQAFGKIHQNDCFRIVRALEAYETTRRPISERQNEHGFREERYKSLKLGLCMDRAALYDRIDKRAGIMIDRGLLDETRSLFDRGYSFDLKPMQSIGYRHMGLFLERKIAWDEAVHLLKRDTRRYAKRQFTWFNKDKEIIWIRPSETEKADRLVRDFLHSP